MAFLSSLNIPLSGMTAERFRLDIIAQNVTNADTYATRPEDAYKRQMVVFGEDKSFKTVLLRRMHQPGRIHDMYKYIQLKGVQATRVVEDPTPAEPVYSPNNPLADEFGYVYESNVNVMIEEQDAIEAQNMFDANRQLFQAMQGIIQASLNIGKG
ncbi:MAG: flagellar basal body rod protein FlgC [Oscillospiraceae bacterium]|nr:flagellar basal body rod protein FlgC [Oscillospiraceae bacterium]